MEPTFRLRYLAVEVCRLYLFCASSVAGRLPALCCLLSDRLNSLDLLPLFLATAARCLLLPKNIFCNGLSFRLIVPPIPFLLRLPGLVNLLTLLIVAILY